MSSKKSFHGSTNLSIVEGAVQAMGRQNLGASCPKIVRRLTGTSDVNEF
jgi:hypothetical protein